jgi:oligopeptide/dipeptide ABC transporter ATP-binding protein
LAALPRTGLARGELKGLAGAVPSLLAPPRGCRFAPRCAHAIAICRERRPPAEEFQGGHSVACVRATEPVT